MIDNIDIHKNPKLFPLLQILVKISDTLIKESSRYQRESLDFEKYLHCNDDECEVCMLAEEQLIKGPSVLL